MYKHLMFDLDGTLWDMQENHKVVFQKLYFKFNFETIFHCNFEDFYTTYNKINRELWQEYQKQHISKEYLDTHRFSLTFDYFAIPPTKRCEIDKLITFVQNEMANQTLLMPFAMETLTWLKQRKYKMSIISNGFVEMQYVKLRKSGLRDFFDWVFLSEEVGVPKPQKAFFEHAIRVSQCKPGECVVVGDDYIADIQGAGNAGLDQIYFHGAGKEDDRLATYHIHALNEIKKILS